MRHPGLSLVAREFALRSILKSLGNRIARRRTSPSLSAFGTCILTLKKRNHSLTTMSSRLVHIIDMSTNIERKVSPETLNNDVQQDALKRLKIACVQNVPTIVKDVLDTYSLFSHETIRMLIDTCVKSSSTECLKMLLEKYPTSFSIEYICNLPTQTNLRCLDIFFEHIMTHYEAHLVLMLNTCPSYEIATPFYKHLFKHSFKRDTPFTSITFDHVVKMCICIFEDDPTEIDNLITFITKTPVKVIATQNISKILSSSLTLDVEDFHKVFYKLIPEILRKTKATSVVEIRDIVSDELFLHACNKSHVPIVETLVHYLTTRHKKRFIQHFARTSFVSRGDIMAILVRHVFEQVPDDVMTYLTTLWKYEMNKSFAFYSLETCAYQLYSSMNALAMTCNYDLLDPVWSPMFTPTIAKPNSLLFALYIQLRMTVMAEIVEMIVKLDIMTDDVVRHILAGYL